MLSVPMVLVLVTVSVTLTDIKDFGSSSVFQILECHFGLPLQEPEVSAGWPGCADPQHCGGLEEDGC